MSKKITKLYKGKTSTLIDLCDSITDCHHSTPKWTDEGKIVIRSFNVKKGKLLLDEVSYTDDATFQERISRSKPNSGDIIITREAPMGEVCIIPQGVECCLGQRLVLIKPNLVKINNQYLLYALLSEYVQIQIGKSDNTGSTVSNLRIPDLKKLRIPLNDKQDKIAAVLSALDAKIELNNRINAELESLAKTIYDYWFVQFDFPFDFVQGKPSADGKPYKSSGGEMVYAEEGKGDRAIPAGWQTENISQYYDFLEGPGITKEKYTNSGHKFINIRCIENGDLDVSNASMIKDEYIEKYQHFLLAENDVVISTSGTLGRSAIVRSEHLPLLLNTSVIRFRPKIDSYFSFMYLYLKSEYFLITLSRMATGSIQKNFGPTHLEQIREPFPPKDVLLKFSEITLPIIQKTLIVKSENQQLTQLRDWLLPMLMNGQVSIK